MRTEPERELIRRVAPFAFPAGVVALVAGAVFGGWGAGVSAAIGVAVVFANLAANAYAMSWAAGVSLTAVYAVGLGGFVVRLGVILAIMFVLNDLTWFSPVAFALSVIPATVALLVYEMKLLGGPAMQQWNIPEGEVSR